MEKPTVFERIEKMRNGEKIKCPKCENGHISAVGEPKTTSLFKCDECGIAMRMTKKTTS